MGHEITHALASTQRKECRVPWPCRWVWVRWPLPEQQRIRQYHADWRAGAAVVALELPNSRTAESEADRIGIELAAKAGYDPHAAVTCGKKSRSAAATASREWTFCPLTRRRRSAWKRWPHDSADDALLRGQSPRPTYPLHASNMREVVSPALASNAGDASNR